MYFNRFVRLSPLLGACILMTMLVRFLASGPFWPFAIDHLVGTCGRYWWSTLSFTQNYVNQDALVSVMYLQHQFFFFNQLLASFSFGFNFKCYPHAWYLSVDMQLFAISPFVVYLIHRYRRKAIIGLVVVILGCMAYTFIIHVMYNITHLYVSVIVENIIFHGNKRMV